MKSIDVSGLIFNTTPSPTIRLEELSPSLSALPTPVWGVLDLDKKRESALKILGERWLLHPKHSPKKGDYDPWGKN